MAISRTIVNDQLIDILMSPAANLYINKLAFSYLLDEALPSPLLLARQAAEMKSPDPIITFYLDIIGSKNVTALKKLFPTDNKEIQNEIPEKEFSWQGYLAYSEKLGPLIFDRIDSLFKKYDVEKTLDSHDEDELELLMKLYANDPRRENALTQLLVNLLVKSLQNSDDTALKQAKHFLHYLHLPSRDTEKWENFFKKELRTSSNEKICIQIQNLISQDMIKKLSEIFPKEYETFQINQKDEKENKEERPVWSLRIELHSLKNFLDPHIKRCVKFFATTPSITPELCQAAGIPSLALNYIEDLVRLYCEDSFNARNTTIKNFLKTWVRSQNVKDLDKLELFIKCGSYLPDPKDYNLLLDIVEKNEVRIVKAILEREEGKELIAKDLSYYELPAILKFLYKNIELDNLEAVRFCLDFFKNNLHTKLIQKLNKDRIYRSLISQKNIKMITQFLHYQAYFPDQPGSDSDPEEPFLDFVNNFFECAIEHNERANIELLITICSENKINIGFGILSYAYDNLIKENKDLFFKIYKLIIAQNHQSFISPNKYRKLMYLFNSIYLNDDIKTFSLIYSDFSLIYSDIAVLQYHPQLKNILLNMALRPEHILRYPQSKIAAFLIEKNTIVNVLDLCAEALNKKNHSLFSKSPGGQQAFSFYKNQIIECLSKIDVSNCQSLLRTYERINTLKEMFFEPEIFILLTTKLPNDFVTTTELCDAIQNGPSDKINILLSAISESKEFNINPIFEKPVLCEAIAKDLNLANKLIQFYGAKCIPAIYWMIINNKIGLFINALQLLPFKQTCHEIGQELLKTLKNRKPFLLALLANGFKIDDPELKKNEKRLADYKSIIEAIESKFDNPTEKTIQFLLKTPGNIMSFFSSSKDLLKRIEKNPGDINEIIKNEINLYTGNNIDEDFFIKLILIANILHTTPNTPASIKKLDAGH